MTRSLEFMENCESGYFIRVFNINFVSRFLSYLFLWSALSQYVDFDVCILVNKTQRNFKVLDKASLLELTKINN